MCCISVARMAILVSRSHCTTTKRRASMRSSDFNRQAGGMEQETIRLQDLVGVSAPMADLADSIRKAARCSWTVLIQGESGTGKGMVARAIHHHGQRSGRPFVVVNCGAIPENLVESDLFGYERGAFTGADRQKKGKFEAADAGTIFLDEI